MDNILKVISDKTRITLNQATNKMKDKIEVLLQKPTLSLEELAAYIATHPHSIHNREEYLGLSFNFYHLLIGDLEFYLETKGNFGSYILELTISDSHEQHFKYYSYQHKLSPQKPLKLPETINNIVK